MSLLSPGQAMDKKHYDVGRDWDNRTISDHGFSEVASLHPSKNKKPVAKMSGYEETEEDDYNDFESASTMEYGSPSVRLIDDPDIDPYINIYRYLEITPDNYLELQGHATGMFKRGMFNRFDGGTAIKWKSPVSYDMKTFLPLLRSLQSIKEFKAEIEGNGSPISFATLIAKGVQGFERLEEMDLSNCSLTDDEMRAIIKSTASRQITKLDIRGNRVTSKILPDIREKFKRLKKLESDIGEEELESADALSPPVKSEGKQSPVVPASFKREEKSPSDLRMDQLSLAKAQPTTSFSIERPMSTPIPEIARGYEDIYLRFIKGKLIYKPNKDNDVGRIELPFSALSNPLEGMFDLSRCGDVGKYLSIATGYRKGQKAENKDKTEVWIVPKFVVERNQATTAKHLAPIMDKFTSPVGVFWTYGGWANSAEKMGWYDYLTVQNFEALSNGENLYEKWQRQDGAGGSGSATCGTRVDSRGGDVYTVYLLF